MCQSVKILFSIFLVSCFMLFGTENVNAQQWQTKLVQVDIKGYITYHPEETAITSPISVRPVIVAVEPIYRK